MRFSDLYISNYHQSLIDYIVPVLRPRPQMGGGLRVAVLPAMSRQRDHKNEPSYTKQRPLICNIDTVCAMCLPEENQWKTNLYVGHVSLEHCIPWPKCNPPNLNQPKN